MVGTDPAAGSATSNIPLVIIPLKFHFATARPFPPAQTVCGDVKNTKFRVKNSPMIKTVTFSPGGTNVGKTQYVDAFQRANFWSSVSTASPNYHVLLNPVTMKPAADDQRPAANGKSVAGPCARIGEVDINFFDNIAMNLLTSLGHSRQHSAPVPRLQHVLDLRRMLHSRLPQHQQRRNAGLCGRGLQRSWNLQRADSGHSRSEPRNRRMDGRSAHPLAATSCQHGATSDRSVDARAIWKWAIRLRAIAFTVTMGGTFPFTLPSGGSGVLPVVCSYYSVHFGERLVHLPEQVLLLRRQFATRTMLSGWICGAAPAAPFFVRRVFGQDAFFAVTAFCALRG